MRICFLAPAQSYHTRKWCTWFAQRGHEVHVISFSKADIKNTTVHVVDSKITESSSDLRKLEYLLYVNEVKKLLSEIGPDFVNAHRAPSYGMVAALSGAKNYALSVWGDDIYVFPQKTILHKLLLRYSLYKAHHLLSTSKAMAIEGRKYTKKTFEITPFGVDMELFSPQKRTRDSKRVIDSFDNSNKKSVNVNDRFFVIGTVKKLSYAYGIDTLLKAAHIVQKTRHDIPLQIRIAGTGISEREYQELAKKLDIEDITVWLGFLPQEQAAAEWANMDLAIIPSRRESFGVSAVEAQACGTPVVVSDIDGLKEATYVGKTSICFRSDDEKDLASKIITLYDDPDRRLKMGYAARQFVSERFEINQCFNHIEQLFISFCSQSNS